MVKFGSPLPFAEPAWYDDRNATPYYNEHHVEFRAKCRRFVDEQIIPNIEAWEKAGEVPITVFKAAGDAGLLLASAGWPEAQGLPQRPAGYDGFFPVIWMDELSRCGSGGVVWGLTGGLGIGLPPVVYFGSPELVARVAVPVLQGHKRIALAVSEPGAGSDVANLATTATEDGEYFVVSGLKKWITCGMFADFFTAAVRTGEPGSGMAGVSVLLIERCARIAAAPAAPAAPAATTVPAAAAAAAAATASRRGKTFRRRRDRPGVSVRPMQCMGAHGSGTAYVEFDEVRVPKSNLVGDVTCLLRNFVTERIGLAVQATRFARVCLAESIAWARKRKAFGKPLEEMQVGISHPIPPHPIPSHPILSHPAASRGDPGGRAAAARLPHHLRATSA